jgi:outer membrane murein-binding lipoprotein Lpp
MMRAGSGLKFFVWMVIVLALVVLPFSVARSQQRRRTSRRVTHPVRTRPVTQAQPTPVAPGTDPTLVSTAEDEQGQPVRRATPKPTPDIAAENERKLEQLSTDFAQLNRKLTALEKERQADLLQQRLTAAEQRGETLRAQLSQTMEKQADLQSQLEQIDYNLRPESIELRAATIPTLHADDVRTQIRQQLESEKRRVRAQLDVLDASRTHLETAIVGADADAERLRTRLNQLLDQDANGGTTAAPSPTPYASPPPPAL